MSTENENDFSWDKDTGTASFFGEDQEDVDVIEVVNKDEEEDITPVGKDKDEAEKLGNNADEDKEEDDTEDVDFFSDGTEEVDEDLEEEEEEEEEEDVVVDGEKKPKAKKERATKVKPSATLEYLKEKGMIDYELEDGQKLTDTLAEEIMEDDFDTRIDNRIAEMAEDMPEVAGNFFKYIKDGGNVNEFLVNLAKQSSSSTITAGIDLTVEANQMAVVKDQLLAEGNDLESVEAQIEFFKSSGKLSSIAASKYKKWEAGDKEARESLGKAQKAKVIAGKENDRKLKKTVTDFIKYKEEISILKLSRKEKKELPSYMTDKSVQLQGGGSITEMQKDLHEALKDDGKAILIAKLLKSDFDFTAMEEQAANKVAKKAKEQLNRNKRAPSKSGETGSHRKRGNLADLFN